MAKKDLKQFVRYDGNNRIVPGSNQLLRKIPKDGNWRQIRAYECCDPNYDTTTTTTTGG